MCKKFSNAQVRSILIVPVCLLLMYTVIPIISIYILPSWIYELVSSVLQSPDYTLIL